MAAYFSISTVLYISENQLFNLLSDTRRGNRTQAYRLRGEG